MLEKRKKRKSTLLFFLDVCVYCNTRSPLKFHRFLMFAVGKEMLIFFSKEALELIREGEEERDAS